MKTEQTKPDFRVALRQKASADNKRANGMTINRMFGARNCLGDILAVVPVSRMPKTKPAYKGIERRKNSHQRRVTSERRQ